MAYTFVLTLLLLVNGVLLIVLKQRSKTEKPMGTLLILNNEADKESYVALEFSEKELFSHRDGDLVVFKIEHRNANTGYNEKR